MADPRGFAEKTSDFLAWFKSQPGTTFHQDIEIQDLRSKGAGRGIVATADIPAETVLFTIPRQSIICKETSALVSKLPRVFDPTEGQDGEDQEMADAQDANADGDDDEEEDDKSQDSWTTLILILIYEYLQGATSQWRPYLDVLPAGPAEFTTPMFWSTDDLAELQASPVASKVGRDEAENMIRSKVLPVIKSHEDIFFASAAGGQKPSDEDLVQLAFRMGSVIMAYAFDLEKEDEKVGEEGDEEEEDEWIEDREGKTMLGMVPMADILNADAAFNAHIEHGEHALTATSLRPIAKGDEILNYYGPLSNGELLRRYGYVTPTHRRWNLVDLSWDAVLASLRVEMPVSEKDWNKLLGALDEDELEEGFVIDRGADDPDSEGRVSEITKGAGIPEELLEQLKEVMKVAKKVSPNAVPDKATRDRIIYAAIEKALHSRVKEYGTTLEQDLELYSKTKDSPQGILDRKSMALDVRIGEKVLLKQASETVREKLAGLAEASNDGDEPRAKRRRL